jgi:dephospho-CoA kinase
MGSGKSVVARRLGELGAAVLSADEAAREVTAKGAPGLVAIVDAFGVEVLRADGSLDREWLARRVFGDPEAVARLNAITHPLIRAHLEEAARAAEAQWARVVVLEIPLLDPEQTVRWRLDGIAAVVAPEAVVLERLAGRGVSAEEARARWAYQPPAEKLVSMADWVIRNDGSLEDLAAQVDHLWADLLKRDSRRDDSSG